MECTRRTGRAGGKGGDDQWFGAGHAFGRAGDAEFSGAFVGIASLTRTYVDAVALAVPEEKQRPVICDTRKTTPGYRMLDKYAVRCGGGVNHRIGLFNGVMFKDNHLAALRERRERGLTLSQLTSRIRANRQADHDLAGSGHVGAVERVLGDGGGGAEIIELDNFSAEQMKEAVAVRDRMAGRILLEASGGITLETLPEIVCMAIDRISSKRALTHSAGA